MKNKIACLPLSVCAQSRRKLFRLCAMVVRLTKWQGGNAETVAAGTGRAQARVSGVVWPLSQVFGGTPEDL